MARLIRTVPREEWWFTRHAAQNMIERGFTRAEVLDCLEDPEVVYCSPRKYRRWEWRHVAQRNNIAVVVDIEHKEIVTVLLRQTEAWGKQAEVDQP